MAYEREAAMLAKIRWERHSYQHEPGTGVSTLIIRAPGIDDRTAETLVAYLNTLGTTVVDPVVNGKTWAGTWRVAKNQTGRLLTSGAEQGIYRVLTLGSFIFPALASDLEVVQRRVGQWSYRRWYFDADAAPTLPANTLSSADLLIKASATAPVADSGGVAPTGVLYSLGPVAYNRELGTWSGSIEKVLLYPVDVQTSGSADADSVTAATVKTNQAAAGTVPTASTAGKIVRVSNVLDESGLWKVDTDEQTAVKLEWSDSYVDGAGTVYRWQGQHCTEAEVTAAKAAANLTSATNNAVSRSPSGFPERWNYIITKSPLGGGGGSGGEKTIALYHWDGWETEWHTIDTDTGPVLYVRHQKYQYGYTQDKSEAAIRAAILAYPAVNQAEHHDVQIRPLGRWGFSGSFRDPYPASALYQWASA